MCNLLAKGTLFDCHYLAFRKLRVPAADSCATAPVRVSVRSADLPTVGGNTHTINDKPPACTSARMIRCYYSTNIVRTLMMSQARTKQTVRWQISFFGNVFTPCLYLPAGGNLELFLFFTTFTATFFYHCSFKTLSSLTWFSLPKETAKIRLWLH